MNNNEDLEELALMSEWNPYFLKENNPANNMIFFNLLHNAYLYTKMDNDEVVDINVIIDKMKFMSIKESPIMDLVYAEVVYTDCAYDLCMNRIKKYLDFIGNDYNNGKKILSFMVGFNLNGTITNTEDAYNRVMDMYIQSAAEEDYVMFRCAISAHYNRDKTRPHIAKHHAILLEKAIEKNDAYAIESTLDMFSKNNLLANCYMTSEQYLIFGKAYLSKSLFNEAILCFTKAMEWSSQNKHVKDLLFIAESLKYSYHMMSVTTGEDELSEDYDDESYSISDVYGPEAEDYDSEDEYLAMNGLD